jgi:hypothetical protein
MFSYFFIGTICYSNPLIASCLLIYCIISYIVDYYYYYSTNSGLGYNTGFDSIW